MSGADLELTSGETPVCDAACIARWERIVNESLGVDGSAYLSDAFIGRWPAEIHGFWLNDNNWYPLDFYKQTLCGNLHHFDVFDGRGFSDEMDWNIYIIPDPPYMDLYERTADLYRTGDAKVGNWFPCDGAACIDAEITPDEAFFDNPWFPVESGVLPPEMVDQTLCTYGPWVRDEDKDNKPEIHPSELFWWKYVTTDRPSIRTEEFWLMQVQDDSNRFDTNGDFDFGGLGSGPQVGWRPWAAAPRRNMFKIAFSLDPRNERVVFEIGASYNGHVRTNRLEIDEPLGDDTGRDRHTIEYNGEVVVEAYEQQPNDEDISLKFVDVYRNDEDTRLYGYLQIYSAVGWSNDGEEGYHVIYVEKTKLIPALYPDNPILTQPPEILRTYQAPPVSVLVEPRQGSLRRAVSGDQVQLLADVDIRFQAGEEAIAENLRLVGVNLFTSARDNFRLPPMQTFLIDPQNQANLINLEGVPLFGSEELQFTFGSGDMIRAGVGGIAFDPLPVAETPLITETTQSTWPAMASAAGAEGFTSEPPNPLLHVPEWRLEVAPLYAAIKEGVPAPEDESPWSEAINEVLQKRERNEFERLFGSTQPFSVLWEFEATNLSTGEEVPVAVNQAGPPGVVRVELVPGQEGGWEDAAARVIFPEQLGDAIYRLHAKATMKDSFGNTGQTAFEVWSEILPVGTEGDIDEILAAAANLAGASQELLLFAANTTDFPKGEVDPILNDPILRLGRMLRLYALQAAQDGRITVRELERLLDSMQLFRER